MTEKLLEISDLYVKYKTDDGDNYAVNGISFPLEKGKTIGLVGETGAGKTTTALAIMRLLPKDVGIIYQGSINFDGTEIRTASDSEMRKIRGARISMIFQDPMTSLNPVITVEKQIEEVLEIHNPELSKAQMTERVEEILRLVGIDPIRKTCYPHQFSGGMKQRVVIAMALACQPELLIADEPTTALDVTIQAQVLNMMEDLKVRLNTSMILITHDLGIVAETCDYVAIMYAGEVIEYGTLEQIFDRSRDHHPYTVGLFGSIPNLNEETPRLKPIDGLMPDPSHLPEGCKFHPRCPYCSELCKSGKVPERIIGGHRITCHMFSERKEA
ncbi:MAG: ABC transporter ATP-binding protein [Flexilinea sp.]|nr:ABC transporter ATP-binding protein [Flexilinea sp.]